jgi:hypothetical protein
VKQKAPAPSHHSCCYLLVRNELAPVFKIYDTNRTFFVILNAWLDQLDSQIERGVAALTHPLLRPVEKAQQGRNQSYDRYRQAPGACTPH